MKIAVLFPGQGSQFLGMGKEFIDSDPNCAAIMEIAESVCDFPLSDLVFNGPMEKLTKSAILQPAVTVTNLICLQALKVRLADKMSVSCFGGHSLGEYSALCAAGVISTEDAIKLVERRGFFMEREGEKNPGGMRAVIGLGITEVEDIVNCYEGSGVVTIANHNTEKQIVISGTEEALEQVSEDAESRGGKVIALNVSIANHSPLIEGAVPDFSEFMKTIQFNNPEVPVYFNVSSKIEEDTLKIREMMEKQIASRVRWYETISRMVEDGIDTFIEVGPKTVLKGMMRKIVPKGAGITTLQFDNPSSLDTCLEKLGLN